MDKSSLPYALCALREKIMTDPIKIKPPLTDDVISKLKAGDRVLVTGVIYTGRDMAHKYMVEGHQKGEKLP
jgi:fumarate hydratase subunit beta